MKKIKEIDDSALAITRRKYGRGYAYYFESGQKIKDRFILKRIKNLVVPPMWTDVLICKFDDGHIQAIGRDLKGRKQYIYHSVYEKQRQEEKFRKLLEFVKLLPKIREEAYRDLKSSGWPKKKLVAMIILLLDEYGIRIGNKQYRDRNETYGLTTLRRKHLTLDENELIFSFKGKSNQLREVQIDDTELVPFIKRAADLPGYEIFRYRDENGSFQNVDSEDVNEYITEIMGADFSSKYFRTWAANRLAIDFYPEALIDQKKGSRKKFSNIVIKMVASELGNTPTVCRDYYVHPAVFNALDKKEVPHPNRFKDAKATAGLSASEKLARQLIEASY